MNSNEQQYHQQLTLERIAAQTTLGRLALRAADSPADGQQREHLQQKVRRIEAALDRLERGAGFGVCQQCSNPIQPDRLALLPYAELCVGCQRQLERQTLGIRWPVPAAPPRPQLAWQ